MSSLQYELVRVCSEKILNVNMNDTVWCKATLPVSRGGLGIRRTEELALPAYLASMFSVSVLVTRIAAHGWEERKNASVLRWQELTALEVPAEPTRHVQKAWDSPLVERCINDLIGRAGNNEATKARLLAASEKESGAWLQALPAASLGTLLDRNALRISCALRLGAVVCQTHECRCGKTVDELGHHGLSCKFSAGRQVRHSQFNNVIHRALCSAQIPAVREPPGISRDNGKRPDGLTLVPWKQGR